MAVEKEIESNYDISYFDTVIGKYDSLLSQELEGIYRITPLIVAKEIESFYDLFLQGALDGNYDISYFDVIGSLYDVKQADVERILEALYSIKEAGGTILNTIPKFWG